MEAATSKSQQEQDQDLKDAAARPSEREKSAAKTDTSYTVMCSETGEDGSYVKIGVVKAPTGNQREARKRALALDGNAELRDKVTKGATLHLVCSSSWNPFPVHVVQPEPDLVI